MMRIAAFDFGIKTGWASADEGMIQIQCSENMSYWNHDINRIDRDIKATISRIFVDGNLEKGLAAGLQQKFNPNPTRKNDYNLSKEAYWISEFLGCAEKGIEYMAVHSATLKKFATGMGRADKQAMLAAARSRFKDRQIQDDNEGDALLLLDYGRKNLWGD